MGIWTSRASLYEHAPRCSLIPKPRLKHKAKQTHPNSNSGAGSIPPIRWRNIAGSEHRATMRTNKLTTAKQYPERQITRSYVRTKPYFRQRTSHSRNQKRFHSRSGFGYGILLYIRKMPYFRPFTALFGGFEGNFSYKNDKSATLCPGKTEVADFVLFKGSIVQGINLCNKYQYNNVHKFDYL